MRAGRWPEKGLPTWARVLRALLMLAVIIAGVLTQFNVTIEQDVTAPKVIKVAGTKLTEKSGEIPENDCYGLAEDHGDVTKRAVLDTYGYPKAEQYSGSLRYGLVEDSGRECVLSFDGWEGNELDSVQIDLYRQEW